MNLQVCSTELIQECDLPEFDQFEDQFQVSSIDLSEMMTSVKKSHEYLKFSDDIVKRLKKLKEKFKKALKKEVQPIPQPQIQAPVIPPQI